MILKKLVLPGSFVQAHPYFDTLWLVRMDGTVVAFDTEAFAETRLNGSGSAAAKCFARNDKLVVVSGKVNLAHQVPDVRNFLSSGTDVDVSESDLDEFSYSFSPASLLEEAIDLKFYSGRAYAATDQGLAVFRALGREDLDLASSGGRSPVVRELQRWTDAMPLQIQARFGTVNASCGEDGGLYWTGTTSTESNLRRQGAKFADLSFASEFAGAGIANVEGPVRLTALPATKVAATERSSPEGGEAAEVQEIVDIGHDPDNDAVERFDKTVREGGRRDARAIQAFVTTRRAFVLYSDGWMTNFAIAGDDKFSRGPATPIRHVGPGSRILSMTTTAGQVIAECKEDVSLLENKRWQRIYDGPAFAVRGFPQSKWYRNLVTVVGEDRVELILLVKED